MSSNITPIHAVRTPALNTESQDSFDAQKMLKIAAKTTLAAIATLAYLAVNIAITVAGLMYAQTFHLIGEAETFVMASIMAAGTKALLEQKAIFNQVYSWCNQFSLLKTEDIKTAIAQTKTSHDKTASIFEMSKLKNIYPTISGSIYDYEEGVC